MKRYRILALLLAFALALPLAACGKSANEKTTRYEKDGIAVTMRGGCVESDVDGTVLYLSWDEGAFLANGESFDMFREAGLDPETTTLEDYAEMCIDTAGVDAAPESDEYGNVCFSYTYDSDGETYFYYDVVKKGSDAFWICNFVCLDAQRGEYEPLFAEWAASIEVE